MGAIFLGGVGLHFGATGDFHGSSSAGSELVTLKYAVFALLWVSSFQLEIWTLQGVRSIDPNCELQESAITPEYTSAAERVSNQLFFNTALLILLGFISIG